MALEVHENPQVFRAAVDPFLLRHEAEHNLLLGIVHAAARSAPDDGAPYMALDRGDDGRVSAVAVRFPGRPAVLSRGWKPESMATLAQDMRVRLEHVRGILAEDASASAFASLWRDLTGVQAEPRVHERIYELTRVRDVPEVEGFMRDATDAERGLLVGWIEAFNLETTGSREAERSRQAVEAGIPAGRTGGLCLWCVEARPVAVAGYSSPTVNGIQVAPVYTPPEHRRHGYATALVAALSHRLLACGYQALYLYTDLENPTSNHIYQQIGYRPVADATEYRFIGLREADAT